MSDQPLSRKLEQHEQYAARAVQYLIDWLSADGYELEALARGRHVTGHYLYGDTLMYEYDARRLKAEAAEELADAVNYIALMLRRADSDDAPSHS